MFSKPTVFRTTSFRTFVFSLVLIGSAVQAQPFQDCNEALATAGGAVALADATTSTTEKKVDEWESEIIKFTLSRPGVLVLAGEGTAAQGSLYAADPASGSPRLVDGAQLGTEHRPLTAVVRPGDHCVRVTPPAGATGNLRLRATFFDVCRLGPQDDHGDSFLCATEMGLGEARSGEISAADHDLFSFALTAAATVTVTATGAPDLSFSLYGEDGTPLAADGRGTHTLGAGRYFLRIAGPNGTQAAYGLTIAANP